MLTAIDWVLTIQVIATVVAAVSAIAAWRAASASRDAVRVQQRSALIADLNDLHGRLGVIGIVLDGDPDYEQFESYKAGLGRHLAVIDMPLPNTRKLWRTEVPGRIEAEFEDDLRSTQVIALHEVEHALAKLRRPRRRWWKRR
jgi:hypothetical protein